MLRPPVEPPMLPRHVFRSWVLTAVEAVVMSQSIWSMRLASRSACLCSQLHCDKASRPASLCAVKQWPGLQVQHMSAVPSGCHRMLYRKWYCTAFATSDGASVLDPNSRDRQPIVHTVILLRRSGAIHRHRKHVARSQLARAAAGCIGFPARGGQSGMLAAAAVCQAGM